MAELFISYAKPNRGEALMLAEELRGRGFSVWIDQGGIGGAKNWSAEIVEAIDTCSTMLVLLSPASIASRNVAREVQLASEKGRNILPVVIERVTLPRHFEYSLAGIQRVSYHDRPAILHALELLKEVEATEVLPLISSDADPSIRVAVLPFDDLSPQHDNQWFADGMMDELISTLGHIEHVKVPARSDVLHYRDHNKKSREIAGELGVRYLIEGGVRKANDKIRINASLTDTLPGEQLWSDKFDGTFEDVFAFQELVSKNIADALKLKLTPKEKEAMEDRGTENAEAYELYLKGRHEQYYLTKESYLRALDLYEQASKLDPKYAQAYIGIASVCCVYYREYSRETRWIQRAEECVCEAEAINGETSKSLWIRGMIAWLRGDNEVAVSILERAAALDPKNYNVFNVLGSIYMTQNNHSAAVGAFQRVTELVESIMGYFNLLSALDADGRKDQLEEVAKKALPAFDRLLLRETNDEDAALSMGFVLFWAGMRQQAEECATHLIKKKSLGGQTLFNLGSLYDKLGKPQVKIALFRRAIDEGYREIEETRTHSLETKDAACEREFQALVKELEELVKHEKVASEKQGSAMDS